MQDTEPVNHNLHWTEAELDFLRENVKKMTHKEIAFKLKRTHSSVQVQAKRINAKTRILRRWKEAELRLLHNTYISTKDIVKMLPYRSYDNVRQKREKLGYRRNPEWYVNKKAPLYVNILHPSGTETSEHP